jgi:hypothetical protein
MAISDFLRLLLAVRVVATLRASYPKHPIPMSAVRLVAPVSSSRIRVGLQAAGRSLGHVARVHHGAFVAWTGFP